VTHEAGQTQGLAQWKPEWGRQDFINEAVRLTADDRYGEAESLLLELLGREPGDPEVCRLLATLHLRSGQLASAKVEFQFLAEAAIRAQDFKLAESMLSECLKTVPDCVSLLELLGRVYEQVGDAESASKRYGRALEVLVEQPDLEQPNLPLELYERIKAITPASPLMARFAPVCGSVSVRQGGGEAKQIEPVVCREERSWMVQEAGGTEQPPDRPSSAFKFAGPSRDREEARQAEETPSEPASPSPRSEPAFKFAEAASAPQAGPESQVPLPSCSQPLTDKVATGSTGLDDAAHYELGVAYRNMGLRDEAIEEFRLVGRGTTWFVEASLMLAACLKEQGQNRPALASLEEALADGSGNEDKVQSVRYELGLLYEAEGLFEQACQQFSLIPDFRDVPQRLEQMDRLSRAERPASAAVDPGSGGPPSEERPAPERKKRRVSYL
jgi:tetratricopeptide (TPR) repeat protein